MKIKILYEFKEGPYGGVNQFLKALKLCFEKDGLYTTNIEEADAVLFNSSNNVREVIQAKIQYPNKIFIQRIDGPTKLYSRRASDTRDIVTNLMNYYIADATIFQSDYSRNANKIRGLKHNDFEITIKNAPDESLFYKHPNKELKAGEKVKIVATSWSSNWNKGFEVYQFLDDFLDYNQYEMYFIGNSPIKFNNIIHLQPMKTAQVADFIRESDIYITASQKDPCSNSLIEAIFCGIPVIAFRDGGHPELVGEQGELFDRKEEIPLLLDKIVENYSDYIKKNHPWSMSETAQKYSEFAECILKSQKRCVYAPKKLSITGLILIEIKLLIIKIYEKIFKMIDKSEKSKNK